MEAAHVDAVMILGEVFSSEKPFDFGRQDTTLRIQKLVPTIIAERLCAPPEEIYSLHRKLSGVFLLCSKLKVKMSCRDLFLNVYNNYKKGWKSDKTSPKQYTHASEMNGVSADGGGCDTFARVTSFSFESFYQ